MDLISMDARLLHPFTLICSGPTGSGKTQFVKRLILEDESVVDKLMTGSYGFTENTRMLTTS